MPDPSYTPSKEPSASSPSQDHTPDALTVPKPTTTATTTPSSPPDEKRQRIRIKNRRKMYIDTHPSYFSSPDLEIVDPLLYDRCVRRFQSHAEREADGRAKGYSGVLEADLYRSEAKLAALAGRGVGGDGEKRQEDLAYVPGPDGQVLPEDEDEVPKTKEEGMERWREAMTLRFLRGGDEEFDYGEVDGSEEWDVIEREDAEEHWFEEEEPEWVEGSEEDREKRGETGIQDF